MASSHAEAFLAVTRARADLDLALERLETLVTALKPFRQRASQDQPREEIYRRGQLTWGM